MNSWTPIPLDDLGPDTKETELEALGHFVSRPHTGAKAKEWADRLAKLDVEFELEDLQIFLGSLAWRVRDYRQQYESEVDDIVTRLRDRYPNVVHPHIFRDAELVGEAAKEIERLRSMCEEFAQSGKEFGTKYGSDVVGFRINEKKFRKAWEKYKGGAW